MDDKLRVTTIWMHIHVYGFPNKVILRTDTWRMNGRTDLTIHNSLCLGSRHQDRSALCPTGNRVDFKEGNTVVTGGYKECFHVVKTFQVVTVYTLKHIPDNKVHEAYMWPTWGRQDPGGPHVGPMNLAIKDSNVFCSAPIHYLNQRWLGPGIVQLNVIRNSNIYIQ